MLYLFGFVFAELTLSKALTPAMKSTLVCTVLVASFLLAGNGVGAWGGMYNSRFSPEMLQNMGYGFPHHQYQVSLAAQPAHSIRWPRLSLQISLSVPFRRANEKEQQQKNRTQHETITFYRTFLFLYRRAVHWNNYIII